MFKALRKIRSKIKSFRDDQSGATAVMVAAAMVPIVAMSGLAIDTTRGFMLKSQLGYAIDAAGLAAGRELYDPNMDDILQSFFQANFPDGYLGSRITNLEHIVDSENNTLTVNASAEIDTTFLRVIGHEKMSVSASATIQRSVRGMELALVLDTTGSMNSGNKIGALRVAATDLVDVLFGEEEQIDNFWVSIVPYVASVNVGQEYNAWLTNLDPDDFPGTEWKGCVEARDPPYDQNDEIPDMEAFTPYIAPSSSSHRYNNDYELHGTSVLRTPNRSCGHPITPLTQSRSVIQDAVDELVAWPGGGTTGNLGLVWGWRTISPNWRGMWQGDAPADYPLSYDQPLMDKAVVMMTDGNNQWYRNDYNAYGRLLEGRLGSTSLSGARSVLNDRMENICDQMKAEGIRIFTIVFRLNNSETQNLFRRCASEPNYYFNSPNNASLREVFRQIGAELSNLRLAQ